MKKYILNKNIALRSWRLVPYAYYVRGIRNAMGLKAEEYDFLSKCDGVHEFDDDDAYAAVFLRLNMIHVSDGSEQLSDWQKPRFCDNRYFPAANWSITGKCNYNCRHCFMAADNARLMREFSRDEWQKTLDALDRCGVQSLTLTGGEPTIHPDFVEIVREIYKRGMVVNELTTNGCLVNDILLKTFREIGANPLIKISFDCIGHHDWMRGKVGAEAEAMAAIDTCKRNGFAVRIQTCVHRLNIDTLYETAELMAKKGVEQLRIIRTTEVPRWEENAEGACFGLEEYYDLMLDFTERYAAAGYEMEVDIWQFLQIFPKFRRYHYRPVEGSCHSFRDSAPVCRGNRGMIAINSDGSLVPCNQLSGTLEKRGIHLGNIKTGDLQEFLQESEYLDYVTCPISKLHEKNETCRKCEYKKLCAGGCRALAVLMTEDYYGIDPTKCSYFKNDYMEKTDAVFRRVAERTGICYHNFDDVRMI